MSKRQFKSQASSDRAGATFGAFGTSAFGTTHSSSLSYIQEPIDYSAIDDANVVVALKNLSKKDGTTKAKALEDLLAITGSTNVDIPDGLLEIWARVFPRLSIDNNRRVRQLTHNLNGQICSKSGKRTVRHLTRIVGPWLAGTFDFDRAVARSASDALDLVFPSAEKIHGVRKTFQRAILEYSREAALHESVGTLSDERSVTADDAVATYSRVVATSFALISSLLTELDAAEWTKERELYTEILTDNKFLEFVSSTDAAVRRAVHRLIRLVVQEDPSMFQDSEKQLSTAYIYKGLHSDQTGSALDFLKTLVVLTTTYDKLWTDAYSGKKPALSRLRHFLKQGSQSSSAEYWRVLGALVLKIPKAVMPTDLNEGNDLLEAARAGAIRREDRANATKAWSTYFTLNAVVASGIEGGGSEELLRLQVLPCVKHFLFPSAETESWTIPGTLTAVVIAKAANVRGFDQLLSKEWPSLASNLVELARMSQPEQSKDFDKSQTQVATAAERYSSLQEELWKQFSSANKDMDHVFVPASTRLLDESISLIKSRNGKPYGAAAVITWLLRRSKQRIWTDDAFRSSYTNFAQRDMPGVLFGPSLRYLLQGLYAISDDPQFQALFTNVLRHVLSSERSAVEKTEALQIMLENSVPEAAEAARSSVELQEFVKVHGAQDSTLLERLVTAKAVTGTTTDGVLEKLIPLLASADQGEHVITTVDQLTSADPSSIQRLFSHEGALGKQLLADVLRLENSSEGTVSLRARSLAARISMVMEGTVPQAKYSMLKENLEHVSEASMPLDALLGMTRRLLDTGEDIDNPKDILPSHKAWQDSLSAAANVPPHSLAIMSPFGGAVHLVESTNQPGTHAVQYDSAGLSQPLRMAMYVGMLFTEYNVLEQLGDDKNTYVALLQLTARLSRDNLSISGAHDLWNAPFAAEIEPVIVDFVSEMDSKVLDPLLQTLSPTMLSPESTEAPGYYVALRALVEGYGDNSPLLYYGALVEAEMTSAVFDQHGGASKNAQKAERLLKERRTAKKFLPILSTLFGFQQPLAGTQTISRYCNELVAEITDLDFTTNERHGLERLVTLRIILRTHEDIVTTIVKQRLIFLVKKLLTALDVSSAVKAEVCKLLTDVLPGISDMYGEHWQQALGFVCNYWHSVRSDADSAQRMEEQVTLEHASLKLYGTLLSLMKSEDPNDDLIDALKDKQDDVRDGLINLLRLAADENDESHQPLMITHELLARQVSRLPAATTSELDDLYPLMYAQSRSIQQAAFDLLHQQIPAAQEKISFDAALDNKTAHLPEELLSLILEAPTLESLVDESFDRTMPRSLQGYLFSWRLLFDHFNGSSFRVKNDYIEQLKDGTYLPDLLTFVFDFLGHSNGKPVNVSKFDIQHYFADSEPSPEKDVQWLLTHLYYLALTYMPTAVKSYYLDIRSRRTAPAVESWTSKYLSPLIISAALQEVSDWAEKSVKDEPEYENMTVKVGMKSREINVGYTIDEQVMAMRVVLPEAYPLASAQVQGVNRVAVREEKWQSWLRNCQGVITFSNGSITDGLSAWRKNVTGALKGQSECAICYSIISADKQLPTKRCQTCKNLFHSSCLFKWFKTSNASTCPLCRTAFNFN